jgi:hypothetical protein
MRGEVRRRDRDLQPHPVAVGDTGLAGGVRRGADRDQREAAAEERMRRVDDLDLARVRLGRVLEGGIN